MKAQNIGKITIKDFLKANRKASRDLSMENSNGWVSMNKIHRNKKSYTRKIKHRKF